MGISALISRAPRTVEQAAKTFAEAIVTSHHLKHVVADAAAAPPTGALQEGFHRGIVTGDLKAIRKGLERISDSPAVPSAIRDDAREGAAAVQTYFTAPATLGADDASRLHLDISDLAARLDVETGIGRPNPFDLRYSGT
jgi:hypothetical protein